MTTIKQHCSGMPREMLLHNGPACLSDRQLLETILGSGIQGKNKTKLAEEVLQLIDRCGAGVSAEQLLMISGIGKAKTALVCAAIEFCRRMFRPAAGKIREPRDALQYLSHYADRKQEMFICISLNGAHEVIATRVVSIGLVNRTIVHPREVFADPLKDRASAVIVAHNHPSGNTDPSLEDEEVTVRLRHTGEILGVQLLDHIIFSAEKHYSFNENGKIA
ncbi:MAG: DNA repair protein RadC [Spirochaetales bacterium]|nr:DNA repair protein RadC [Spirochaetales bacterium]